MATNDELKKWEQQIAREINWLTRTGRQRVRRELAREKIDRLQALERSPEGTFAFNIALIEESALLYLNLRRSQEILSPELFYSLVISELLDELREEAEFNEKDYRYVVGRVMRLLKDRKFLAELRRLRKAKNRRSHD